MASLQRLFTPLVLALKARHSVLFILLNDVCFIADFAFLYIYILSGMWLGAAWFRATLINPCKLFTILPFLMEAPAGFGKTLWLNRDRETFLLVVFLIEENLFGPLFFYLCVVVGWVASGSFVVLGSLICVTQVYNSFSISISCYFFNFIQTLKLFSTALSLCA